MLFKVKKTYLCSVLSRPRWGSLNILIIIGGSFKLHSKTEREYFPYNFEILEITALVVDLQMRYNEKVISTISKIIKIRIKKFDTVTILANTFQELSYISYTNHTRPLKFQVTFQFCFVFTISTRHKAFHDKVNLKFKKVKCEM